MVKSDPSTHAAAPKQLGWWISRICTPGVAEYEESLYNATGLLPSGEAASGLDGAPGEVNGTASGAAPSAFGACYQSAWFPADEPAVGEPLYEWLDDPVLASSKLAFCFCATTPAAREELWGIVLKYASLFRWLALGLLLFFLAAVAAETYLLCCLRDSKLKLTLRDGSAPWADPASLAARSGPQQP